MTDLLARQYDDYWKRQTAHKTALSLAIETKEPGLVRALLGYESTPYFQNCGLRYNEHSTKVPDTDLVAASRAEVLPKKKAAAPKKKGAKKKKKTDAEPVPTNADLARFGVSVPIMKMVVKETGAEV